MQLGCFNRPWTGCDLDRAFAGIASAGFRNCGLMRHQGQAILSATSTPETIATLREQTARHGLSILCNLVRVALDIAPDEAAAQLKAEIDVARSLGIPYLLTGGTNDPARHERFYAVMQAAAPYAAEHGVTLVLKPHGGISATNRDCVAVVERVGSAGFGIWYDPGNIIHYTATDPEADLAAVAPHVVGMSVKDCVGGHRGSVNLTPGDGKVRFERIFPVLLDAGFDGPALVESLGGQTPEQTDAEARRVHGSLLRWIGGG
jgi:sugar phosphate isomerase/epimerase